MRTVRGLRPADRAPIRALAAAAQATDGVAPLDEQSLLNLDRDADPARPVAHLVLESDGALVGYAQEAHGGAELVIDPAHRGAGHGAFLLDQLLVDRPGVRVWAHGDLAPARALAASRHLGVVRELLVLATDLTAAPTPEPPDGVVLSTFTPADEADWVRQNARAFAHHPEQGRLTRADLRERTAQPWFDPDLFWLARDADGALLASLWVKPETPAQAELYVLGVDPDAQGRGLGGLLTEVATAALAAAGARRMVLYVDGDNAAALATYARAGFAREHVHVQYAR